MKKLKIDTDYLQEVMLELLAIPSPVGFTDEVVHYTCGRLDELGVPYEITRTGAIKATVKGETDRPACAVVAHLDTLGANVRQLKDNGRLRLLPIGTWSSRFAEGARVTLFTDNQRYRGTILPLMASGHAFNEGVDTQPVSWDHIELRVDEICDSREDLEKLGVNVGDFVAIDPQPEITPSGYIASRHLDDKAGVAALLAALKALLQQGGAEVPQRVMGGSLADVQAMLQQAQQRERHIVMNGGPLQKRRICLLWKTSAMRRSWKGVPSPHPTRRQAVVRAASRGVGRAAALLGVYIMISRAFRNQLNCGVTAAGGEPQPTALHEPSTANR